MAVPSSTLWDRDPHTAAKHQIVGGYLDAWFPIIARRFGKLTYAEGYAGPNEYTAGEPGSPAIAMQRGFRDDVVGAATRYVFVEERRDRFEHLQMTLERDFPEATRPSGMTVHARHGQCETDLLPGLGEVGARGAPIFANLDGWGADIDRRVVAAIGSNQSSEVLVTFAPSFYVRFAGVEELEAGDRVFGDVEWRRVGEQPDPVAKRQFLDAAYRTTLRRAGFPHVLMFEMVDEGGHSLYLFFGTTHPLGVEKMKDAMWKVDPSYGVQFRDPRDPNQLALDIATPQLMSLEDEILAFLAAKGPTTLETIRDFVALRTIYRRPHATSAVRDLIKSGRVTCPKGRLSGTSLISH